MMSQGCLLEVEEITHLLKEVRASSWRDEL